ncbi:hypothetical protein RUND412_006368 [Rhizina undulata]
MSSSGKQNAKDPSTSPNLQSHQEHISTESSTASSRAGSRPGSSNGERVRPNYRVRFGSGEALDNLNNRQTFNLRDPAPAPESPNPTRFSLQPPTVRTPPITLTPSSNSPSESEGVSEPRIKYPQPVRQTNQTRAFSFSPYDEISEKYDQFSEKEALSSQERAARLSKIGNFSAPNSAQNSPTLNAYSVGAGQAQGGVPVDDIPLLDLESGAIDAGAADEAKAERPRVIATKEAHELVRQHTQRGLNRFRSFNSSAQSTTYPRSGAATPIAEQRHDDYVRRPETYRGGVLGSLLKLYSPPPVSGEQTPQQAYHGHSRSVSSTGAQSISASTLAGSPPASGRTTPKWYSKSANTSTTSLGGLLSASGSSLVPNAATSGRKERPKLKHRPHSGGVVGALKHSFQRPNLEEEIKITIHIAETLARQKYIIKLCRALMLYGAPTHRLEEYMKMTARVLEIDGQFLYIPGCMIVSFGDASTHTSDMQIVRVNQGVDLGKLHDTHLVYKEVVHDVIGVEEATQRLDEILKRKPKHNPWLLIPVYGLASASVGPFGFKARLIDMPILFILGCILGFLQLIVAPNSELYSNVFEISAAILMSFLARAFGSIRGGSLFCFSALAQASIALILPGYIILCGSLELQSKNIVGGSVRMFYAIIYSLFLGFGITIGSALYALFDTNATSATTCENPLSWKYNFIFVPPFAWCLLTINQARWRQAPVMLAIAMAGYCVNFFSSQRFPTQPQVANGLGAFTIGVLGNLYSRIGHGLAFAAMLPAIFVQVPSGLAAQGSLISGIQNADSIVNNTTVSSSQFGSVVLDIGFSMIQVAIGITVGLFAAALVVYPYGKKRSGLFSF